MNIEVGIIDYGKTVVLRELQGEVNQYLIAYEQRRQRSLYY